MTNPKDVLSELRILHEEICASDGGECEMMALVRRGADEIERLHACWSEALGNVTTRNHEIERLQKTLKGLSNMYARTWDRVDGALVLMPDRIPDFEKAHSEARIALGEPLDGDDNEPGVCACIPLAPRSAKYCSDCGKLISRTAPRAINSIDDVAAICHSVTGLCCHILGSPGGPCTIGNCAAVRGYLGGPEFAVGASRDASPGEPVYRKWPGEPPHCMSCDCGMTDEQKRTVPEADYLRIHKELMDLKYPGSSPADLVGALQDVVHTDPGPVRAAHAVRDASSEEAAAVKINPHPGGYEE